MFLHKFIGGTALGTLIPSIDPSPILPSPASSACVSIHSTVFRFIASATDAMFDLKSRRQLRPRSATEPPPTHFRVAAPPPHSRVAAKVNVS